MIWISRTAILIALAAATAGCSADASRGPIAAGSGVPVTLSLPVACEPGKDCWVANYVDVDDGPGSADFNCGPRTLNGHRGTDFMVRDLAALEKGVEVLAAADGVVAGYRDGMDDIDFRRVDPAKLKGRKCGNGVMIVHNNGWSTQYCHLRKDSVRVRKGDRVRSGQVIGLVGESGWTEFPNVQFTVRWHDKIVDPFIGLGDKPRCGMGASPLWSSSAMDKLAYEAAALYNAGISTDRVSPQEVHDGKPMPEEISRDAKELNFWVDMLGVRAGDGMILRVTDENGRVLLDKKYTLTQTRARAFHRLTVRRKAYRYWPPGLLRSTVELARDGPEGPLILKIERTIRVQ